jgi:hypothetical protein
MAHLSEEEITRLRDRICALCSQDEEHPLESIVYAEHASCRRPGEEHDCWPQAYLDRIAEPCDCPAKNISLG